MLNLKVCETEIESGFGFDYRLNRENFIYLFKKSKNDISNISKSNSFSLEEAEKFIYGISRYPLECKLQTDNVDFIYLSNKVLRSTEENQRILVIDNHNFFHRSYHAFPPMVSTDGIDTSVLKALANFLKWLLQTQDRYTHIVFSTEGGRLKRKDFYPEYKASRKQTDGSLKNQIKLCEDFLRKLNFNVLSVDGFEADDVLASIVHSAWEKGIPVTAFTSDKDALQLGIYPGFEVMNSKREVFNARELVETKYSILPENFTSYQAIVGDTSDNIPGAKGFGNTAAQELIPIYGTIDNIFNNIDSLWSNPDATKSQLSSIMKKRDKLLLQKENVYLSKDLVTLRTYLFDNMSFLDSPMPYKNFEYILKQEFSKFDIVF